MNSQILVTIFVALVFIFGGLLYVYNPEPIEYRNPNEPQNTICSADAKLCPDGNYVGRSGPDCQFVCPEPAASSTATTTEKIKND